MKMYKIKHKPTGLYLCPISGGSNLSKNGKIYQTQTNLISYDLNHGRNSIRLRISKKQYDKFKDINNCESRFGYYWIISTPKDFVFENIVIVNDDKNQNTDEVTKISPGSIIEKLKITLNEINYDFNQDHMPKYNIPYDYANDCIVFFYPIGGILLWKRWCIEFSEDDGHWFVSKHNPDYISHSWLEDKEKCYKAVNTWLKKYGKPYYYSGTDIICGYEI